MGLKNEFNAIAQQYNKQRTRFIPCFDDFYGIAIESLDLQTTTPQILDLGAGTGLLSEFVLQKYPEAKIELVDLSEKMLDVAKQRFANNPNITINCSDFTQFVSNKSYDAIISSLAIHHLEDSDKIKLFGNIHSMLKPNGLFINAEQVEGENSFFATLNDRMWRQKVESTDLTKEEIKAGYQRVLLDKRSPLSKQISWLKEAGFSEVDCLYKYYDFTVIFCKK